MAKTKSLWQLQSSEWLTNEYVAKLRSIESIAVELGVASATVKHWLKKHGIQTRKSTEAHMLRREDDSFHIDEANIHIFNGSMLGDASVLVTKKTPRFSKTNIHYDHVFYVASRMFGANAEKRITFKMQKLKGKLFPAYQQRSLAHEFLLPYREKWYPASNSKKKLVPRDLVLTPETVLHWFLDDGYSAEKTRNGKIEEGRPTIGFCSESFDKKDNEWLVQKMAEIGIIAYVSAYKKKWRIKVSTTHAKQFYDVIGPCPPELEACMGYKWKFAEKYEVPYPELRDKEWLVDHYVTKKLGSYRISKILGCDPALVLRWLHHHQIPLRPSKRGNYKSKFPQLEDKEYLIQEYRVNRRTGDDIVKDIGCSVEHFFAKLREHGIERWPARTRSSLEDS